MDIYGIYAVFYFPMQWDATFDFQRVAFNASFLSLLVCVQLPWNSYAFISFQLCCALVML